MTLKHKACYYISTHEFIWWLLNVDFAFVRDCWDFQIAKDQISEVYYNVYPSYLLTFQNGHLVSQRKTFSIVHVLPLVTTFYGTMVTVRHLTIQSVNCTY